MQIVIDIDEEILQDLYDSRYVSPHIKDVFRSATPLPKGHGRLIDADALNRKDVNCANVPMNFIDTAPTIIKADEESEGKA